MRTKQEFQFSNDAEILQEIDSANIASGATRALIRSSKPSCQRCRQVADKNDCLDDIANG
jgi:lactam utilization protein B